MFQPPEKFLTFYFEILKNYILFFFFILFQLKMKYAQLVIGPAGSGKVMIVIIFIILYMKLFFLVNVL